MMLSVASLAMYADPPPLADANAALWTFLATRLEAAGVVGVPPRLADLPYDEAWLRPDLLLAQTCGYPYVERLRGRVRLVATPAYLHPGCEGPRMRSFVVVREADPAADLEALRGRAVALNDRGSNSGANLLRDLVAPLARAGRFFGEVLITGGHLASIDAVGQGRADVAAIDCVTFGNMLRHDSARLAGLRVLCETRDGPGLPLITRGDAPDGLVEALRAALDAAAKAPALAAARRTLGLSGFAVLEDVAYGELAGMAARARALGYPEIA